MLNLPSPNPNQNPIKKIRQTSITTTAEFPAKLQPLFGTNRYVIVHGGRGGGKLIDANEVIPTPAGWSRLGDIQIGDAVFDEAGQPCTVTDIHDDAAPTDTQRMHFSDKSYIDTHGEHEWVTWTHIDRKALLRHNSDFPADWPNWQGRPQTRTTNEIAKTLRQGKRLDLNHCIPLTAPLQLPSISLPIEPYVYGYWLANGGVRDLVITTGSHLGDFDAPHIIRQYEALGYAPRLLAGRAGAHTVASTRLAAEIKALGLQDKSHIPPAYLRASISQREAFLAGLLDGDGTCNRNDGVVTFSSTTIAIAETVHELAISLGEKATLHTRQAMLRGVDYGPAYDVSWRPTRNPFRLPRKAALVRPLGKQALRCRHRMITCIEPIASKPMRCLTVDGANHMYLVGTAMIPTHNSWGIARALLLLGQRDVHRILCCREIQQSIGDSVHRLLCDQIFALGLSSFYTIEKQNIRGTNGTEFRFSGIKSNVQQIKSFEGITICWVEEAANVSKYSWETLIPTIRTPGSRIFVSMNPELETDDSYKRWIKHPPPDSVVIQQNWRDNPWIPETLLDEIRHLKKINYHDYLHVYEGHCKRYLEGAVYIRELQQAEEDQRICSVPYDPATQVQCFFDLGYADSTAIWVVQKVGFETHAIDYIERSRKSMDYYLKWLSERPYPIDHVWLPHDAKAKALGTGKSIYEIMRGHGHKTSIVPNLSLSEGINAVRSMFPTLWIDRERCAEGVTALRHYRFEVNETKGGGFKNEPVHDKFSHGCDAMRYCAIGLRAPKPLPSNKYRSRYAALGGRTDSWMAL